jgi:bis(5'-nucleosyl)-tetraphosphatase (symmetrical)
LSAPSPLLAIGDVQGCLDELQALLARAPPSERIVFVGDLVNRGPQSLATLRFIRGLGARAVAVLGNHDLHLLAVDAGIRPQHKGDTFDEILAAPDRAELIDWLRARPLAWQASAGGDDALFVHAGLLPAWTAARALQLAGEVEAGLRGADWRSFLATMYGNQPARWDDSLRGADRARCIINALTRMRYLDAAGAMNLVVKDTALDAAPGLVPWFDHPARASRATPVVFGHWAALGLMQRTDAICLDSGCVWGNQLSALAWPSRALTQVPCARASGW